MGLIRKGYVEKLKQNGQSGSNMREAWHLQWLSDILGLEDMMDSCVPNRDLR